MPFLDRNTLGVKLGGVDIHKVMCDGYQVWPDTVVGDWRMLTKGHTHGNYGKWLEAGLKASTDLGRAFEPNKFNDPWWDMDIDRGTVPMPMFQIFNLAGGRRHVRWGGPWLPQWNAVTTPPQYRYSPTPHNHAYPIKEVRVGIPHGGGEYGIRVEVDVDPLKMNGGNLTFEGCPLPFSKGRTPSEGGQSRTGDTYIYEAKTSVFFMRIEQSFFTPPPDISKILLPFTAEGVADQKDGWFLSLMHVTPPNTTLLFNWPNNFILVGGRFINPQMGDDSVHHIQPYTDSAMSRHFAENFSADPSVDLGPGNALKLRFHGTPPANWPAGGDIDLFDLAPWNA